MDNETKKAAVRDRYGEIALTGGSCGCSGAGISCCGGGAETGAASTAETVAVKIGYSVEDLRGVPAGANLGLGCGNPTALAALREGETVVDLGSGAGFDCFLAARRVGPSGRVIGVDMTAAMISRARKAAADSNYANVEFRLGEIEHLPVADAAADAVISNCVINLSTDKPAVFAEAFRVLRPGGRLMVSDIVLEHGLPPEILEDLRAYASCVAGAVPKSEYLGMIADAGFSDIRVLSESPFGEDLIVQTGDGRTAVPDGALASIAVSAVRPQS